MKVKVGHSPDPDDAFMFYPIKKKLIDLRGYEVEEVVEDIETLNKLALSGELDVSAVSAHAYAYLADNYDVLASGASMGKGYGPVVVSKEPLKIEEVEGKRIAVPGELTTATLLTKIYLPPGEYVVIRFDKIPEAVLKGEVDVGVLIHEGQITYKEMGLHKVADLGELWYEETGLPTPLGLDVTRKEIADDWAKIWREAVEYSLSHPKEALEYAMPFARGLSEELVDKFVHMYVNEYTVDMGGGGGRGAQDSLQEGLPEGIDT
ncbi:ABC transporter substrate-binding protein [Ignicoccus pacificus DSM 13166]|uniref:1,4-dihydroxy-6-naphtoate synthase n=1 Tax=Ignicoccus pacificus DSM 13166 TaxID=940294 RepID=A0A977K986_9CREN|nr:ABC transporter substrate-binding protein [Ignicoccus pacificus DSM 13166]